MKKQGIGNREQGTERRDHRPETRDQGMERLVTTLRKALPPVGDHAEMRRDLWPAMEQRMRNGGDTAAVRLRAVPWIDWALAGGVALFAVAFPTAIPVLLYYL